MSKRAFRLSRTVVFFLGGVLLAIATVFFISKLINAEYFRQRINTIVSRKLGAQFSSREIGIHFLPAPTIIIRGSSLESPGKMLFACPHLEIVPNLLSLLTGSFEIARIYLNSPTLVVRSQSGGKGFEPSRVLSALSGLARNTEVNIIVDHGTIQLRNHMSKIIRIFSLQARIHAARGIINATGKCRSSVFSLLRFSTNLDFKHQRGTSEISLENCKLDLLNSVVQKNTLQVHGSVAFLRVSLRSNNLSRFSRNLLVNIRVFLTPLTIYHASKRLLLEPGLLSGSIQIGEEKTIIQLNNLDMHKPKFTLSGIIGLSKKAPRIIVQLTGTNLDVGEIRDTVLEFSGSNNRVRKILNIIKEGTIPYVTIQAHANEADRLTDAENLVISGIIKDGEISIPHINVNLKEVSGKALIALGVLEGEILQAETEGTSCKNGFLILDLKKKTKLFHLETDIETSLSEFPEILSRLIKGGKIHHELTLIERLEGKAKGRFIIGESFPKLSIQVIVTHMNFDALYRRIPYTLVVSQGTLSLSEGGTYIRDISGSLGGTGFTHLSAFLKWSNGLHLWLSSGSSSVNVEEIFTWIKSSSVGKCLRSLKSMAGEIHISSMWMEGNPLQPGKWRFKAQGVINSFSMDASFLPGRISASKGLFTATPNAVSFERSKLSLLDTQIAGSGIIYGYLQSLDGIDLNFDGTMRSRAYKWIEDLLGIPKELRLKTPVRITKARIKWRADGKSEVDCFLDFGGKTRLILALSSYPGTIDIRKIRITDYQSKVQGSIKVSKAGYDVEFSGFLSGETLDRILLSNKLLGGWIGGDLRAHVNKGDWKKSFAKGYIQGSRLKGLWLLGGNQPFEIIGITLAGTFHELQVVTAEIRIGGTILTGCGNIKLSEEGYQFGFNVITDRLCWSDLIPLVNAYRDRHDQREAGASFPFQGVIHLRAEHFELAELKWNPLIIELLASNEGFQAQIKEASMCGIETQGYIQGSQTKVVMDITATAHERSLAEVVSCLWNEGNLIEGSYSLKARLFSQECISTAHGFIEFEANEGRIYRFNLLSKIFALLNLTEILRGRLPDLSKEGFAYHHILMKGPVREGKFFIKEGILDGASMDIAWEGEYDIQEKTINLTVLVAPFKTIDAIIRVIPIINRLFLGKLVSIPIKVTGPINDPTVIPLAPSAVGSEILGYIKRALKLPFTIFQPLPVNQ